MQESLTDRGPARTLRSMGKFDLYTHPPGLYISDLDRGSLPPD